MINKHFRLFFARVLVVLQLVQLLTPTALLHAATPTKPALPAFSLGVPSRKVFKEVGESWEGLRPPAYIKNTSNVGGSSFDSTVRLIGSQQKTLSLNKKNKALAEAMQFLSKLAPPGKALERMNCSKRMMSDMQMFYERGLFKSFNRTTLALGQVLQLTQFYQGASSQKEAEERRNFVTGILRTPEAAKAIGIRVKCFSKYENQFLRQTTTTRNEALEQKIKNLEPSRLWGPLRKSPFFVRWHARLLEGPIYELIKNYYMLFAAYTVCNLFVRALVANSPKFARSKIASFIPSNGTSQPSEAESISYAVGDELIGKTLENIALAAPKITYRLIKMLFASAFRQEVARDAFGYAKKDPKKLASSLAIPPLLRMLWAASRAAFKGENDSDEYKERYSKHYLAVPSLTGETFEKVPEMLNEWPSYLSEYLNKKLEDSQKSKKFHEWFCDGDPTRATAKRTATDWLKWADPIRPWIQEGLDNLKAMEDAAKATGVDDDNFKAKAKQEFVKDPAATRAERAAKWGIPGMYYFLSFWDNLNPLPLFFGGRTNYNLIFGNLPFVRMLRVLTGNHSSIFTSSKLFSKGMISLIDLFLKSLNENALKEKVKTIKFTLDKKEYVLEFDGSLSDFLKKDLSDKRLKVSYLDATGNAIPLSETDLQSEKLREEINKTINKNAPLGHIDPIQLNLDGQNYEVEFTGSIRDLFEMSMQDLHFPLFSLSTKDKHGNKVFLSQEELKNSKLQKEMAEKIKEALEKELPEKLKDFTMSKDNDWYKHKREVAQSIELLASITIFASVYFYTFMNGNTVEKSVITNELDSYMFSSLKPAVTVSEMVRQINTVLKDHSRSIPMPTSLKEKLAMLVASATPNCKKFARLAQHKMFLKASKPAIFGDYGTLRCAYKLAGLPEVKKWLSICAIFMAEVDSYLAIARLVAEHKHAPNYFYPVTFIEQEKPCIDLQGFWFPLIGAYKCIPNDLSIGDPAHILITGLNGGGKSFALKGLLFTILMAHAFGYAPVQKARMTFFNKIITHLSTTDNAAEGESCWIAEAKSMGNAIHAMQAPHMDGDKILYIGDELGSGTASHASISAVASLMDIALEQPHVASVITTHLRPLTELEFITKGKVHNYRVGGTVSDEGVIQRKFRLERGRADVNIAELIVNQLLAHGEQKTLAPNASPTPTAAVAA